MTFDASLYETIPQTNVAGTLALVRAVITASKGVSLPAGRKALHRVRAAGEALRTQHQAVPPVKAESVTRATDAAIDRIWSAFAQRLAASIELGGAEGAEAARVYGLLFAKGLTFLSLRYGEQWAEGEAILARIGADVPGRDALREAHARGGSALRRDRHVRRDLFERGRRGASPPHFTPGPVEVSNLSAAADDSPVRRLPGMCHSRRRDRANPPRVHVG
ncbi:MAG: hypothetical protein KF894_31520 [Labilithrix sp.]|nr:hypothetical protein [Labilithrix sp.]